jgi:hypothetical protein
VLDQYCPRGSHQLLAGNKGPLEDVNKPLRTKGPEGERRLRRVAEDEIGTEMESMSKEYKEAAANEHCNHL